MTDIPFCQILYDRRKKKPAFFYKGEGEKKISCLLRSYLKGEEVDFSSLPLDLSFLSSFTQKVLQAVRKIPYGQVISYGKLAAMIGDKNKARAVGMALGKNPLPLIIPCHRVIKSNGDLGGYGGGRQLKKWFLQREGIKIKGRRVLSWKR